MKLKTRILDKNTRVLIYIYITLYNKQYESYRLKCCIGIHHISWLDQYNFMVTTNLNLYERVEPVSKNDITSFRESEKRYILLYI